MMIKEKRWLFRLFILLFTVSVSCCVLPCEIINTYNLFGAVVSSTIIEEQKEKKAEIFAVLTKSKKDVKGINIFNLWFILAALIVLIQFALYRYKLPREDTIVTLKIRMDN